MNISRLEIAAFRNIKSMAMEPCPGVNIIYGDNAQGKTNILEAIWLFTGAKSFRYAKETDYIPFQQQSARIEASFFAGGRQQSAVLCYGEKKKAFLNEIPQPSSAALAGSFNAVVFSPVHLSLIKDGPALRRRFIDGAICQLMPKYINALSQYNRILTQRNALLKDAYRHPSLLDTLEVWDTHLAGAAGYILPARLRFVHLLECKAREIYSGISSGRESLEIRYQASGIDTTYPMNGKEAAEITFSALAAARKDDLAQGFTSVGIHRDDIELSLDGASMRSYGSQGQQRSAVLALKLAECGIIYDTVGEHPAILLDDVMSELDKSRRDFLLNHIEGRQVFITCCEKLYFSSVLLEGKTFHVEDGRISGEPPHSV